MSTVFTDLITYLQAGEAIAANDAIYINSADNKVYKFDATNTDQIFAGIAKEAGVLDEYIRVVQTGRVKGFTGLTPGAFIYASTTVPGGYQEVEPVDSQKVVLGIAKSSTEITINGGLGIKPGGAGGAGGGLDVFYTQNMDGLADASDFSSGNNAAFLGGGVLAGTLGLEEGLTRINGTKSLSYTQAVGSANDYVASPEITVGVKQQNNLCAIQGYYTYDGLDDDMRFVVYDATNGAEISSQAEYIKLTGKATRFQIQFYVPETCVSVQWGFQTLAENDGAVLLVDDVEMTSDPFQLGFTGDTDWEIQEGIEIDATTTAPTKGTTVVDRIIWRRDGSDLVARYEFSQSASGTAGSGEYLIKIPSSIPNIDSSLVTFYTTVEGWNTKLNPYSIIGQGVMNYGTTVDQGIWAKAIPYDERSFRLMGVNPVNTGAWGSVGGGLSSSEVDAAIEIRVPIEGWSTQSDSVTAYSARNASNSMIRLNTGNGHGSTNTKIRRFANVVESLGSAITYTDSATDGASFTIEEDGVYFISYTDGSSGATTLAGISLNSSELTTTINNISEDDKLAFNEISGTNYDVSCSWSGYLTKGSVVRPHTDGTLNATSGSNSCLFTIAKIGTRDLIGIPLPLVGYVKDVKPSGTAGGTFTAGAWQTRDLNTVEGDFSKFGSLSGNQITLQPGEYEIEANAPAYSVADHKLAFYNITESSFAIIGEEARCAAGTDASNTSNLRGTVTIKVPTIFELQHRCSATSAGTGLGRAAAFGVDEIFTSCQITKLR